MPTDISTGLINKQWVILTSYSRLNNVGQTGWLILIFITFWASLYHERLIPIISSFISFYSKGSMWKAVGSVRSGDDKSIRSNKSRQELRFQRFQTKSIDHSRTESQGDRSFCFDYFQKKRENYRNMTFDQRVRSQKSIRYEENNKDDMFTSMRNVNFENKNSEHVSGEKQNHGHSPVKSGVKQHDNTNVILRTTHNKVKVLKKEQAKLRKKVQLQLTEFKNVFLQFEDTIMHSDMMSNARGQSKNSNESDNDYQILKDIISEANGLNSYFGELDRKKDAILAKLME